MATPLTTSSFHKWHFCNATCRCSLTFTSTSHSYASAAVKCILHRKHHVFKTQALGHVLQEDTCDNINDKPKMGHVNISVNCGGSQAHHSRKLSEYVRFALKNMTITSCHNAWLLDIAACWMLFKSILCKALCDRTQACIWLPVFCVQIASDAHDSCAAQRLCSHTVSGKQSLDQHCMLTLSKFH